MVHGRKTKVRFVNKLPLKHPTLGFTPWTSVHLHGSPSLPQYDGYANDITFPGSTRTTTTRTATRRRRTGTTTTASITPPENIWMGMAGKYHVHDDRERSLPIPHGEFDVPIIFGDRMFDKNGQLLFTSDGHDGSSAT